MKIIKSGEPEVLATVNQKFICSRCKCEFVANWDEYEEDIKVSLGVRRIRMCECPECGLNCHMSVPYD